ncbi:hypothetical protein [Methanofollis formosanus]|uniref:hypothetical protein n=1 Tax=Methanofollis formosanus TaxID=299308 RepID=UPI001FEADDEB|nr:hypothetical protein [Methanofollis formosanus]
MPCPEGRDRPLDNCRFCVHSRRFRLGDRWVPSPARAYCTLQRATEEVDLTAVNAVECDDDRNEGFRSIMTVIS